MNYFSPAAATFIAVAMAAAVMSSADSGLLALASVCGKNLLQLLNPKAGDGGCSEVDEEMGDHRRYHKPRDGPLFFRRFSACRYLAMLS